MLELYNKHKGIIKAVAYGVASNTGLNRDDLEAEGNLIFSECAAKDNPEKGRFSHYLKKSLNWGLYSYSRKRALQKAEVGLEDEIYFDGQLHEAICSGRNYDNICEITLEDISRDAKKVVDVVFECDEKIFEGKQLCKKHIFKHLKTLGWKNKQIHTSFREISMLVEAYAV